MAKTGPKPEKTAALEAYGIDAVCDDILCQKTLTGIANEQGVSIGTFLNWVNGNPEYSARVKEARAETAKLWDERAESVLEKAGDDFGLKKARELAHHYRWRSAKISPRDYGDKVTQEVTGPNGGALQVSTIEADKLSQETLEELLRVRAVSPNRG